MTAFTMLLKLSSVRMMSDASFATSVPAMPYTENTLTRVGVRWCRLKMIRVKKVMQVKGGVSEMWCRSKLMLSGLGVLQACIKPSPPSVRLGRYTLSTKFITHCYNYSCVSFASIKYRSCNSLINCELLIQTMSVEYEKWCGWMMKIKE